MSSGGNHGAKEAAAVAQVRSPSRSTSHSIATEAAGGFTPTHPVPSLRAAFEESVLEAEGDEGGNTGGGGGDENPNPSYQDHERPRHHALRKLVAQIAFGMYLLHDRLAKSDSVVVRIVQGHINDMDEFLADTSSDFELANADILSRLEHLQIPLSGGISDVFAQMLESRQFRGEMVECCRKIRFIITRTKQAVQLSLKDVAECMSAVDELAKYLLDLNSSGWRRSGLSRVYAAMERNVQTWFRCCIGLRMKGENLEDNLNKLKKVVHEIDRRTALNGQPYSNSAPRPSLVDKNKPLPPAPPLSLSAIHTTTALPTTRHRVSFKPERRNSNHRRAQQQQTSPEPEPSRSPPSRQEQPYSIRRSISQKLLDAFKASSRSNGELRSSSADKGKQRETVPADSTHSPPPRQAGAASSHGRSRPVSTASLHGRSRPVSSVSGKPPTTTEADRKRHKSTSQLTFGTGDPTRKNKGEGAVRSGHCTVM